jgi:hypothetical protein
MTRRTALSAVLSLTAAAGARQAAYTTGSSVAYVIDFVEVGGNTNGILDPGESALLRLSVSFTNQNTTATYTPASPAPGSGTIRGLGSGFVDLIGTSGAGGSAQGSWNMNYINPPQGPVLAGWDLVGPSGWGTTTVGGDRVLNIQFGQFPPPPFNVNTTNPVNYIWQALWTPTSYAARSVTFGISPAAATQGLASTLLFQIGPNSIASVKCPSTFGSVTIPLVPAPASTLILAAPLLSRRRRPKTSN